MQLVRLIAQVWVNLYTFSLLFFLLSSCAKYNDLNQHRGLNIIENVPFYPQEVYQCGPSSLAGIMNFWGVHVSPEEIAAEIYSESARGTLDADMMLYAERKGLRARHYKGNIEDIEHNVNFGYPLIVLIDYGFWIYQRNHFMVVVGYNENGVVVNSGKKRLGFITFEDFLESWKRANFWTLLITPKP